MTDHLCVYCGRNISTERYITHVRARERTGTCPDPGEDGGDTNDGLLLVILAIGGVGALAAMAVIGSEDVVWRYLAVYAVAVALYFGAAVCLLARWKYGG